MSKTIEVTQDAFGDYIIRVPDSYSREVDVFAHIYRNSVLDVRQLPTTHRIRLEVASGLLIGYCSPKYAFLRLLTEIEEQLIRDDFAQLRAVMATLSDA